MISSSTSRADGFQGSEKGIAKPIRLNKRILLEGVQYLESKDEHLRWIRSKFGLPPLWKREQGFNTLIHIILGQQVSLASAKAAYKKLLMNRNPLTPANFIKLSDDQLKRIGFSRQKTSYGRNVAHAIIEGRLDLSEFAYLNDMEAKERLMKIRGIGSWTADIYLLTALGRPDIWPNGDLALAVAVQKLKGLGKRPSPGELRTMSLEWKPWRAVAARILWHYYLSNRT
ncbi:MAG: DNA-3-methyladenine glycosylase 2 family protein [Deltaproteobacteria bacterium]|nr:DNA-3-methyladenine glycosylase 2 family protein [Deltaproteobacteria bacterium]